MTDQCLIVGLVPAVADQAGVYVLVARGEDGSLVYQRFGDTLGRGHGLKADGNLSDDQGDRATWFSKFQPLSSSYLPPTGSGLYDFKAGQVAISDTLANRLLPESSEEAGPQQQAASKPVIRRSSIQLVYKDNNLQDASSVTLAGREPISIPSFMQVETQFNKVMSAAVAVIVKASACIVGMYSFRVRVQLCWCPTADTVLLHACDLLLPPCPHLMTDDA